MPEHTGAAMPPQRRLLWVDNTVRSFQALSGAIAGVLNWQVRTADSIHGALKALRQQRADIVLVDYAMGSSNGLTLIPDIGNANLAGSIYVCSGFAYSARIFADMEKFAGDIEVGFIPKERLPSAEEPDDIIGFGKALVDGDFLSFPAPAAVVKLFPKFANEDVSPASRAERHFPTWDEFALLDLRGRLDLLQHADGETTAVQDQYFQSGDFAVLFCGNWSTPIRRYKTSGDVPDEAEIIKIAHERGYAPFLFCMGGNVDDLTRCSPSVRLDDYYVVEISYRAHREYIHLDSGNPYSLFGYEWHLEHGWFDPIVAPQMYRAGEMRLWGKNVRLHQAICLDNSGQAVEADVTGFAVTEWTKHRICIDCPKDCNHGRIYPVFERRICRYRSGLLGRNLLREIDRLVTLDARKNEVVFSKRV